MGPCVMVVEHEDESRVGGLECSLCRGGGTAIVERGSPECSLVRQQPPLHHRQNRWSWVKGRQGESPEIRWVEERGFKFTVHHRLLVY